MNIEHQYTSESLTLRSCRSWSDYRAWSENQQSTESSNMWRHCFQRRYIFHISSTKYLTYKNSNIMNLLMLWLVFVYSSSLVFSPRVLHYFLIFLLSWSKMVSHYNVLIILFSLLYIHFSFSVFKSCSVTSI